MITNKEIALITDLHLGANKNSIKYFKYQKQILLNIVNDLRKKHIKDIVICGDVFDSRKSVEVLILNETRSLFKEISDFNIYILTGNHDLYYTNSGDVSSISLLEDFPNITIYNKPVLVGEQNNILMCPWLSTQTETDLFLSLLKKKPKIVFGHFDINGFQLTSGVAIQHGFGREIFSNVPLVISGHIHLKQKTDNIIYIGVPYDINFGDAFTTKGHYILNTASLDLNFIHHDQHFFQFFDINEENQEEVIRNISENPDRIFKFRVTGDCNIFKNYIETEYNYPENIRSISESSSGDNEEEIKLSQTSIKDQLVEFIKSKEIEPKDRIGLLAFLNKIEGLEV